MTMTSTMTKHDDVPKWKHSPRYWHFVRGIHRSPVNFPHKGQRRGALMFSLICSWINSWVNNREAGDLRRHRAHYYVIVVTVTLKNGMLRMMLWWMATHKVMLMSVSTTKCNYTSIIISYQNDEQVKGQRSCFQREKWPLRGTARLKHEGAS